MDSDLRGTLTKSPSRRSAIVYGIVGLLTGVLIANQFENLIAAIPNVPAAFLIILFIGFLLFLLRSWFPSLYGFIEIGIGTYASYIIFPSFDLQQLDAAKIIQFAGGLYIIVRGLDNIGKDAKEADTFKHVWKTWFPKN